QRLFGGQPEGPAPKRTTATERRQSETTLRKQLGEKREKDRDTDSLTAYLERQGVEPESAKAMARNPKILDAWNQGRGRQEERDFRAQQAQLERDFRAGESEKNRRARIAAERERQR